MWPCCWRFSTGSACALNWDGDPQIPVERAIKRHGHRIPKDLVLLELQPDRQSGFKDPGGQFRGIDLPEGCTEQHRTSLRKSLIAHDRNCPVEVGAIANNDFDLIRRFEVIDVGPNIGVDFTGTRRLDIEDHTHSRIDRACIDRAAGLKQDGAASIG